MLTRLSSFPFLNCHFGALPVFIRRIHLYNKNRFNFLTTTAYTSSPPDQQIDSDNQRNFALIPQLRHYLQHHAHRIANLGILLEPTLTDMFENQVDSSRLEAAQQLVNDWPQLFAQRKYLDTLQSILDSSTTPEQIHENSNNSFSDPVNRLLQVYCGEGIGYELAHLDRPEELNWFTTQLELSSTDYHRPSTNLQQNMAKLVLQSQSFDKFLETRFGQVKRYGLEGLESLLIVLETILNGSLNQERAFIGMAHRGRLNVLIWLLGFPPEGLFRRLVTGQDVYDQDLNASFQGHQLYGGDVISHIAWTGSRAGKEITMLPNSSHLEAVNPVVMGACRAHKKNSKGANARDSSSYPLCIQVHGDGALVAQGIAMETMCLSRLPGFEIGGSVHVITNNQLGFTTPPLHGRSTRYASDIAKTYNCPVLHVNGDWPEAVFKASSIASLYHSTFKRDIFVDLIGVRQHGHNELDEPAFTQPLFYKFIREQRRDSVGAYADKVLDKEAIERIKKDAWDTLDKTLSNVKEGKKINAVSFVMPFVPSLTSPGELNSNISRLTKDQMIDLIKRSVSIPEGFKVHPRLLKHHIQSRLDALNNDRIDWATAEAIVFASLPKVRLCGQDSARGTFSQRHLQFVDQETGSVHEPLRENVEIVNSCLSELAVLGYEYGHSVSCTAPFSSTTNSSISSALTVWEAQFGDFFNGAQVMIDAFIATGRAKWGIPSNLTMLLPHGYDGAGPEHSSCRLERWLQFATSLTVACPTTPANYFHLLREQALNKQDPLIIATPKTMLRLPRAVSSAQDFLALDGFKKVLITTMIAGSLNHTKNNSLVDKSRLVKVILVTGKFYYDLLAELENRQHRIKGGGTADHGIVYHFVRLEQLAPFPKQELLEALHQILLLHEPSLASKLELVWCQEEPANQGARQYVQEHLSSVVDVKTANLIKAMKVCSRPVSATPATGIPAVHKQELQDLFSTIFASY